MGILGILGGLGAIPTPAARPRPTPKKPNQAELEPILANMAEHSMAGAHSEHLARGDTDYVTLDGGFTAPRNAHGCTMAAHVRIDMDADVDVDIDTDRYNTGRAFQPRAPHRLPLASMAHVAMLVVVGVSARSSGGARGWGSHTYTPFTTMPCLSCMQQPPLPPLVRCFLLT